MATQSILVEDCSPLIQYAPKGAWQDTQANDTLAGSYSGGSYHVSSTQGATATFQFRGTGFTITGGRRPGYGSFSLSLNGHQLFDGNPVPDSSPVKNTLATMSGLPNDVHTVVLTNSGGAPVDIDTITFQSQFSSTGTNPIITTIEDTDKRITYLPSATDWGLNAKPDFQDGTLHYSQAPDASASLQFTGNAVALYGTVSPDHADISITVDGETVTMPSGSSNRVLALRTQVLLYWADSLADGQHTMTVSKVQSANTGPYVDIDSFVVYSVPQSSSTANSTSGTTAPSGDSNSRSTRTTIIAGASVAGVLTLLLISVGVFLILRRRRQRRKPSIDKDNISPITPILPMQSMVESGLIKSTAPGGGIPAFPFPPSAPLVPVRRPNFNNKRSSKLSIAPSYYSDPEFTGGNETDERHTRMTSSGSSDLLIPPVPRLTMPRLNGPPQTIPAVVVTDISSPSRSPRPTRPQRPPSLLIGSSR